MKDSMFYKKVPADSAFFRKVTKDVSPIFRKAPKLNQKQMPYVRPMFK